VGRQAVLADVGAFNQAGHHHVPAKCALQAAQHEQAKQAGQLRAFQPAGQPEEHQRYEERDADEAAQEAVPPFPPIDELEVFQAHALVDELVFRNLPVLLQRFLPVGFVERRNGPQNGLPFGDRQA
jgi:hypothetical protein